MEDDNLEEQVKIIAARDTSEDSNAFFLTFYCSCFYFLDKFSCH